MLEREFDSPRPRCGRVNSKSALAVLVGNAGAFPQRDRQVRSRRYVSRYGSYQSVDHTYRRSHARTNPRSVRVIVGVAPRAMSAEPGFVRKDHQWKPLLNDDR